MPAVSTAARFPEGSHFVIDATNHPDGAAKYPGVYKVARKPGTVNVVGTPLAGGINMRFPAEVLKPATEQQVREAQKTAPASAEITLGTVVKNYRNPKAVAGALYVVINLRANGTVDLTRLGGHGNGYFEKVNPRHFTVVERGEVEAALKAISES